MAPGFFIDPILGVVLFLVFLLDGPGSRPRGWILDRDAVLDGARIQTCPAFDEMKIFLGSLEVGLWAEIGDVHHQRIPLPVASRVAPPLAHV